MWWLFIYLFLRCSFRKSSRRVLRGVKTTVHKCKYPNQFIKFSSFHFFLIKILARLIRSNCSLRLHQIFVCRISYRVASSSSMNKIISSTKEESIDQKVHPILWEWHANHFFIFSWTCQESQKKYSH